MVTFLVELSNTSIFCKPKEE